ncbi:MAG: hypothetical protein PHN80_16620 [Hespellia sp.]|nr:hypothetical protein [Hespellia sp.]
MRKKGKALVLIMIIAMFITGCVSHSEIVFQGGKITTKTFTFNGNVAMLNQLNSNPDGISKAGDGSYVVKHEDSFATGEIEELRITQKLFTWDDLEFDGGHYVVQKDMDILTQNAEKIGKVKKGDTIQVIYFVGELAVVLVEDDYGFINATNLKDAVGKTPDMEPIAAGPRWIEQEGTKVLELANQQAYTLRGEAMKTIVIEESVTAETYVNMDFDTLIIENSGNVYIQDCTGKKIQNHGGAKVEIGEGAKVESAK